MGQALKIDRVLLATDLTPACEPALLYAAALASRFGADLYLLHVVPPSRAGAEAGAAAAIEQLRQQVSSVQDIHTVAVLPGDPATRILQKAQDVCADLIVMGAADGKPAPGSVTNAVVCGAQVPVLTVPHTRMPHCEL